MTFSHGKSSTLYGCCISTLSSCINLQHTEFSGFEFWILNEVPMDLFSESYVIIFKWYFAQMMPLLLSFDLNATLFVIKVRRGNHGNFLRLNEWTQQNSIKSQRSWDGKRVLWTFFDISGSIFLSEILTPKNVFYIWHFIFLRRCTCSS